jgi:hypothetical protein
MASTTIAGLAAFLPARLATSIYLRNDYRENTLQAAIERTTQTYHGSAPVGDAQSATAEPQPDVEVEDDWLDPLPLTFARAPAFPAGWVRMSTRRQKLRKRRRRSPIEKLPLVAEC